MHLGLNQRQAALDQQQPVPSDNPKTQRLEVLLPQSQGLEDLGRRLAQPAALARHRPPHSDRRNNNNNRSKAKAAASSGQLNPPPLLVMGLVDLDLVSFKNFYSNIAYPSLAASTAAKPSIFGAPAATTQPAAPAFGGFGTTPGQNQPQQAQTTSLFGGGGLFGNTQQQQQQQQPQQQASTGCKHTLSQIRQIIDSLHSVWPTCRHFRCHRRWLVWERRWRGSFWQYTSSTTTATKSSTEQSFRRIIQQACTAGNDNQFFVWWWPRPVNGTSTNARRGPFWWRVWTINHTRIVFVWQTSCSSSWYIDVDKSSTQRPIWCFDGTTATTFPYSLHCSAHWRKPTDLLPPSTRPSHH